MVKIFSWVLLVFACSSLLCSCVFFSKNKSSDEVVAQAFGTSLYKKDVEKMVPKGLPASDSAGIAQNYIQQWIEDQVLLHKAQNNISDDFQQQLEDYKNSLIVYEYQQKIINQLLDTVVKNEEAEEYYKQNTANFVLKDNIVKVLYVKLDKKSKKIGDISKLLFKSNLDEQDKLKLEQLVSGEATNFYLDDSKWLLFTDILKEIPIETYNQEHFLKNSRNLRIEEGDMLYLLRILDFKIKENISPFSMAKDDIRAIIINKRKVEIVDKMRKELIKEAELSKDVKIY